MVEVGCVHTMWCGEVFLTCRVKIQVQILRRRCRGPFHSSCNDTPVYSRVTVKIASRELGIECYTDRNFTCAMVPGHRLDVHLKK